MKRTVFIDLYGALVERRGDGARLRKGANAMLDRFDGSRLGLVCIGGPERDWREALRLLEFHGIDGRFDRALLLVARAIPCPPDDPRLFAVAAALAGGGGDDDEAADEAGAPFVFVTGVQRRGAAAEAAGFAVAAPDPVVLAPLSAEGAGVGGAALLGGSPGAVLLAGEVDEDTGPTFVLRGRVVPMGGDAVIDDGFVGCSGGRISFVGKASDGVPGAFTNVTPVETEGTIYPGLLDLHNHFAYNVLPLWVATRNFGNRTQWGKPSRRDVSLPLRALTRSAAASRALVRYVEVKALVGGTTTGQGIRTKVEGGMRLFRGAMRNVEQTDDPRLPEASTLVPDLRTAQNFIDFGKKLGAGKTVFYHLSEGVDDYALSRFRDLETRDLLKKALVGVHALGVGATGLESLADAGAKVVWSPFSNTLLYGSTLDVKALLDSGVTWSLGCDWSPSGSKNLLEEMKVASLVGEEAGLTSEAIVGAVTSEAAAVAGWEGALGRIRKNFLADLLVVAGSDGDPYDHLVNARERDVDLVVVHGVARYGSPGLMKAMRFTPSLLERVTVDGRAKRLYLSASASGLDDLTFGGAEALLSGAMADLHGFLEDSGAEAVMLGTSPEPSFTLVLDNEDDGPGLGDATLLAETDFSTMVSSLPLDSLFADDEEHWSRLNRQPNLPAGFVDELRDRYV